MHILLEYVVMEMLELAAELKWCRERIAALEAEGDQLLYSERLHAEALGTAVQEAESLRSERDQLRAELAEAKRDAERYRWRRGVVAGDFYDVEG